MTKEAIRDAITAQPFRPFTVHLADGNSYPVPARDFISLSPTGRTMVIYGDGNKIRTLDVMLVTEIERDDNV